MIKRPVWVKNVVTKDKPRQAKGEIKMAQPLELTAAVVKALDAKRAMNIEVLHTTDVTTLADYFVMATAASTTQLRTLSDMTEEAAEKLGETPYSVEGERESGWRVLDFSSVIVHLFLPQQREFYNLERLWQDAEHVDIAPFLPKPEDEDDE
jgi:ribosome-associated protein